MSTLALSRRRVVAVALATGAAAAFCAAATHASPAGAASYPAVQPNLPAKAIYLSSADAAPGPGYSAGGSAGMVKGVSIGQLLEDYHRAGAGQLTMAGLLAQVKPLSALANGLKKYRAALPANKTALKKVVDDMIKEVDEKTKQGQIAANPVHNLTGQMRNVVTHSAAVRE
jgi:hypothetical protein